MTEDVEATVDVQAVTIGIGTLIAIGCFAYGILVSRTLFGTDTTTLASWVFTATFAAVALVHAVAGRSDVALAYAGAAIGWLLILAGSSAGHVIVGLVVFAGSGAYIARTSIRERTRNASGTGDSTDDRGE